jgi:FAD/FMN-containing dehydrogenase
MTGPRPALAPFQDVRASAVASCASAADVVAALACARERGLEVAIRGGGHCFAGRSSTTGLLIDVSPLSSVVVRDGLAVVGTGTLLSELYDALDAHGVTIPAGCGPTVGIAGLTLGGGLGILGRSYGLTCDRLVAATVVLADGRVVECDADHDHHLFWALRGAGGGQFGVVTSLTFAPVAVGAVTAFHLVWRPAAAAAVIAAWQRWAPDAPDELDASLRLTAEAVNLLGAHLGGESDALSLLDRFVARVGADPESAWRRHAPFRAAKESLVGLGSLAEDGPVFSKSEFFRRPLPAEAIARLTRCHAGSTGELNFTPWGGAYNRMAEDATAFAHRAERFLVEHAGPLDWARESWSIVHAWGAGRVYPNFPDPDLTDWRRAYHGANHERLCRVKRAYDPDGVFRFHQSL